MPKSSLFPSASTEASTSSFEHQRAKSLGLHESIIRRSPQPSRVLTPDLDQQLDSANFEAAKRLLQSRLDAGLTQEAVAAQAGEDPKTIGQRERGKVALGPLRQLVLVERAAKAKKAGSK